ncbi:MAG: beta-ketoacyl synthase N-terminal-like domain-containing protein [Microthrixaceae bacterium]
MSDREEATAPPSGADPSLSAFRIRQWLVERIANVGGTPVDEVDPTAPFSQYGVDSVGAAELVAGLETLLGRELDPTVVFSFESPAELAAHLVSSPDAGARTATMTAPRPPAAHSDGVVHEPIALVGIGCRFPRADGPEEFWRLLAEGRDAIGEVPEGRWDAADAARDMPSQLRLGGFVEGMELFDPAFFGISQIEADRMDPQQRLLLETTWAALEDAAIKPSTLRGGNTGVFVGISANEYSRRQSASPSLVDAFFGTGNALSIAANRLSYVLDLRGPSLAIDTACSSSLAALHLACTSLRRGECEVAIVAGANAILTPLLAGYYLDAGLIAPDGRCKTFDAKADGIVRGEGVGVVVLQALPAARRANRRAYCVIEGSATNQDGRSNGLTAPNPEAQMAVFASACADASVRPADVQYVEAHGTGTVLGDAMELRSLQAVYGARAPGSDPLLVGSVKTNLGHLEAAAGIAGVIKTALSLHHGLLPATLHITSPNPILRDLDTVEVVSALTPWPVTDGPRRAGVSGFGFGGTNVHAILASAPSVDGPTAAGPPRRPTDVESDRPVLLPLSARTPGALASLARSVADRLDTSPDEFAELAAAMALTRDEHPRRAAVLHTSANGAVKALRALAEGGSPRGVSSFARRGTEPATVAFVFSGQGRAWWPLSSELLADPVIGSVLEQCDRELRDLAGFSIMDVLRSGEPVLDHNRAQPLLFALQVAIGERWRAFGVQPSMVIGQSIGELAAAHGAGALRLSDGLELAYHRGRVMEESNGSGHTAFVELPDHEARALIESLGLDVTVAGVTAPDNCLVSGPKPDTVAMVEAVKEMGHLAQVFEVADIPGHGPLMTPYASELTRVMEGMDTRPTRIPMISTVTASLIDGVDLDAHYWGRNIREQVRFMDAARIAVELGADLFVEVAPHPVISVSLRRCLESFGSPATVHHSVKQGEPGAEAIHRALGGAWAAGAAVDWRAVSGRAAATTEAPRYPWDHRRCWFDPPTDGTVSMPGDPWGVGEASSTGHPTLLNQLTIADPSESRVWAGTVPPDLGGVAWALELAVSAARFAFGTDAIALTSVEFGADAIDGIAAGTPLQVVIGGAGPVRRWRLSVLGVEDYRPIAAGDAESLGIGAIPEVARAPIPANGRTLRPEELATAIDEAGVAPRRRPLVGSITLGPTAAVLGLDRPADTSTHGLSFDPALLDVAASVGHEVLKPSGPVVPTRIERLVYRRDPGPTTRAVIDEDGTHVVLLDEWSNPAVEVAGMSSAPRRTDRIRAIVEQWTEAPAAPAAEVEHHFVVLDRNTTWGADLADALSADRVDPAGWTPPPEGGRIDLVLCTEAADPAGSIAAIDSVVAAGGDGAAEVHLLVVNRLSAVVEEPGSSEPWADSPVSRATVAVAMAGRLPATRVVEFADTSGGDSISPSLLVALASELRSAETASAVVLVDQRRQVGALAPLEPLEPNDPEDPAGRPFEFRWTAEDTAAAHLIAEPTSEPTDEPMVTVEVLAALSGSGEAHMTATTIGVAAVGRIVEPPTSGPGGLVAVVAPGAARSLLRVPASRCWSLAEPHDPSSVGSHGGEARRRSSTSP